MSDQSPPVRSYRFGPYCLDPSRRTLTRGDDPVSIAGKAFDVLLTLLERRGQVVEKHDLLRLVWPDAIVEEANLSQQIFMLRKLLGDAPDRRAYIATAPKRGYGFFGDVQVEMRPSPQSTVAEPGTLRLEGAASRLTVLLPHGAAMAVLPTSTLAISPNGRRIAYVAAIDTTTQLYVRDLDSFEARAMPGTDGAMNPFFSPDGLWIGYAAGGRLHRVPSSGGAPRSICPIEGEIRGAAWQHDDRVVFAPGPATSLWHVPASGGTPEPLTTLQFDRGERTHRWPHALPEGRGVVFTIGSEGSSSFDEGSLAITEPGGGHRTVLYHGSDARYVPTGHLIYARRGALLKTPFDLTTGIVRGSGRPVLSGVASAATGAAHFAIAETGALVYAAGEAQTIRRSLVCVDAAGRIASSVLTSEGIEEPRLSPDRTKIVIGLRGRYSNLWLYDFARAPLMRLTFEGDNFAPIWGPEDGTLTFSSNRGGTCDLYCLRPDGGAAAEVLVSSEFDKVAGSWSPDGRVLAYTEYHPETGADIWLFARATGDVRPLLQARWNQYAPVFSPKGHLLAYTSDETGQPEVYVTTMPEPSARWQVSTDGGTEPLWLADGERLVYRNGDRLMVVDLAQGPAQAAVPRTLFEGRYVSGTLTGLANYDQGPQPDTFLMLTEDEPARPQQLSIVLNWLSEIGRRG